MDTSTHKALHLVNLVAYPPALANDDVDPVTNYDVQMDFFCVALAQFERACAAYQRRIKSSAAESSV